MNLETINLATPIPFGSAIFVLVSFIILLLLLKKFAWNNVSKILNERADRINKDLDDAAKARQEADVLNAEAKTNLQKSQTQASTLIDNARANAEKEGAKALNTATAHANSISRQAQTDARQLKEDALHNAKDEIADLALQLAGLIVDKELDKKTHQKLIDNFIDELGTKG